MFYAIKFFYTLDSVLLKNQHKDNHSDYLAEVENKTLSAGPLISKDLMTELGSHRIIEMPNR